MRILLSIFVIFSVEIFFSTLGIIGIRYSGRNESLVYIVYILILFFLSVFFFLYDVTIKKEKYSLNQIILILIPVFFSISFLFSFGFRQIDSIGIDRYINHILWATPSILTGIYISKSKKINDIFKYLDLLMILFGVASVLYSINVLSTGSRETIDGSTYQTISYIAAFSYGTYLFLINIGKEDNRFKFTKNKMYIIFTFILAVAQIPSILLSGGRGGLVLLIIFSLFFGLNILKKLNANRLLSIFIGVIIAIVILIFILKTLLENPIFTVSLQRIFDFISFEGINWQGTSTRDIIYRDVIELIINAPLFGYGIFGMWSVSLLPHNLFLEILVQGGIIYLFLFLTLIYFFIEKLTKLVRLNKENRFVILFVLYPLTYLMFSGSYLNNSILWFTLTFVLSSNLKKSKHMNSISNELFL